MIVVNQIGDVINVSCNGKDNSVAYSKTILDQLAEIADKSEDVKTMAELDALITLVDTICAVVENTTVNEIHPDLFKDVKSGKFYLRIKQNPEIISSVAMPEPLVRRIEESIDKSINVDPLIKCWIRFLRNKKANNVNFAERFFAYIDMKYIMPDVFAKKLDEGYSADKAKELATTYQVKITKEGLINCYKISQEIDWKFELDADGNPKKVNLYTKTLDPITGEILGDNRTDLTAEQRLFMPAVMGSQGDEFYCEGGNGTGKLGHVIRVGSTHRLADWSQVNCDDNRSCVPGLHVGGLDYIKSYSGEIHNVFVDPMNIGAIPDCNTGAIRCIEYFVHSSLNMVNASIYHSSTYAAKTDAQWDLIKQEILKDFGSIQEELTVGIAEVTAL